MPEPSDKLVAAEAALDASQDAAAALLGEFFTTGRIDMNEVGKLIAQEDAALDQFMDALGPIEIEYEE